MLKNAGRRDKTNTIDEGSIKVVKTFDSILLKEIKKLSERTKLKPNILGLPHEKLYRHLYL